MNLEVNIHVREQGNLMIIYIMGEIDTYTAPKLREKFESIKINESSIFELDLSKVEYMDSTGLGVMVGFYKKAKREKAKIKLVGLSTRLKRLFKITGLSELMEIEVEKVE